MDCRRGPVSNTWHILQTAQRRELLGRARRSSFAQAPLCRAVCCAAVCAFLRIYPGLSSRRSAYVELREACLCRLVARQDIGDRSSGRLLENSHVRLCLGRHLKSFAAVASASCSCACFGRGVRLTACSRRSRACPQLVRPLFEGSPRLRSAYVQIFELFEASLAGLGFACAPAIECEQSRTAPRRGPPQPALQSQYYRRNSQSA